MEVRRYLSKPVSMSILLEVLEAGRLSPSAINKQPWRFIAIKDKEALRKIGSLCPSGPYVSEASFAVAIVVDSKNPWSQIDAARAVQSMMLVAWDKGVGSCWVGNIKRDEVKTLLSIPDELHLLTIIPFGYPEQPRRGTKKNRKPLSEVAYLETYGKPFSPDLLE